MEVKIYDTKEEVAKRFSAYFYEITKSGKQINVALSGGSTPKIVFDYLAVEYADKIDWTKVFLYWGDERCVPPSDDESNYKMTVAHLLSKIKIPEANIFRVLGENDPEEEAIRYSKMISENLPIENGIPQFDLVMLGMGDDGHTASVFPYNIELWDAAENCKVALHPDSGQKRVTITGKIINNAKEVAFLVTGAGKTEKVTQIIKKSGNYADYPANLVDPKSGNLVWFLDKAAAAEIE
ncbi:MAG: 6-phosphogluconolactonase [Leeuwenhoekiella sp.]